MNNEPLKVKLTGSHYQPDGCDEAFVAGIFWDKENNRPAISLVYLNGKTDYIPLIELGSSHPLGCVMIMNV